MKNKQWELKAHNSQIADTGDYDGYYELTDGDISLITRDDISEIDTDVILSGLNSADCKWENWKEDNLAFELSLEKKNCEQWKNVADELYKSLVKMNNPTYEDFSYRREVIEIYRTTKENLP